MRMIVIGADTHKRSHTCAAARAGTGEVCGERTAAARKPGFRDLLDWGRSLDADRVWALEDCRHVSGSFERFLIDEGERVVRVPPKLMGESRKAERARGKSDPIDALAIARAALKEGPEALPAAHLDERALELKLLLDHREDLVRSRVEDQQRLRWHLHALWPELELPAGCLDRTVWLERIARKLQRAEQSARVRVSRELVRVIRERTRRIRALELEITELVATEAPELLRLPGCGALTAAKLVAETAGVERFASDAKLARIAGVAPIPASSGNRQRHRLDRGGNRQLNCALHRIAVTQGRVHPPAREFLARKQAEGKSRIEALRCLKRHLARAVWQALRASRDRESINSLSLIDQVPKLRQAGELLLT
jgi:transposase